MRMNGIVKYQNSDDDIQMKVQFESETVWLTQKQMALLFNQTKQKVSLHINNSFKEAELESLLTAKESLTFEKEGNRNTQPYPRFVGNPKRSFRKKINGSTHHPAY